MGGHNDGEQASLLVARSLARRLPAYGPDNIGASVRAVNAELFAQVREQPGAGRHGLDRVGLAAHEAQPRHLQRRRQPRLQGRERPA